MGELKRIPETKFMALTSGFTTHQVCVLSAVSSSRASGPSVCAHSVFMWSEVCSLLLGQGVGSMFVALGSKFVRYFCALVYVVSVRHRMCSLFMAWCIFVSVRLSVCSLFSGLDCVRLCVA